MLLEAGEVRISSNANDRSAIPKLLNIIETSQIQIHIATAIWSLGQLLREVTPDLVELLRNIKHPTDAIIEERTAFFEKFGIQADSQLQ